MSSTNSNNGLPDEVPVPRVAICRQGKIQAGGLWPTRKCALQSVMDCLFSDTLRLRVDHVQKRYFRNASEGDRSCKCGIQVREKKWLRGENFRKSRENYVFFTMYRHDAPSGPTIKERLEQQLVAACLQQHTHDLPSQFSGKPWSSSKPWFLISSCTSYNYPSFHPFCHPHHVL